MATRWTGGGGVGMMENGYYVCIHKQFRFN